MEERIIDDEYGRGIRLKKTAFGYVDVTDELAQDSGDEEPVDEVAFEFPVLEGEDDEDLATLTPEEAIALRKKKAEAEAKRKADYAKACEEGEALLESGEYVKAEAKFEQALQLDGLATHASIGYWRAKTENFQNPDVLVDEYKNEDLDSMEYDLGVDATDTIRREYKGVFQAQLTKLREEEKPLAEKVEAKQVRRREILSARLRTSIILFAIVVLPTLACMVLTAVFGAKIPTTREDTYILPTIILGCAAFVLFILSVAVTNHLKNAIRIYAKNERLSSTAEGKRLSDIRAYVALYEALLAPIPVRDKGSKDEKAEEKSDEKTEENTQPAQ